LTIMNIFKKNKESTKTQKLQDKSQQSKNEHSNEKPKSNFFKKFHRREKSVVPIPKEVNFSSPVADKENNTNNSNNEEMKNENEKSKSKSKSKSKEKENQKEMKEQEHEHEDDHECEQEDNKILSQKEELALLFRGKYEYIGDLGSGSYGHVHEAKSLWDNGRSVAIGDRVAIKVVSRVFNNHIEAKRLLRELRILRTLGSHEAIVSLIDILPPKNIYNFKQVCLVFEYCETDLRKVIKSNQWFTDLHIQYILYQILLGLKYMHSAGIVHRDLKPANILINEDCSLRIADFGLSRTLYEDVNNNDDDNNNNNNDNHNNNNNKDNLLHVPDDHKDAYSSASDAESDISSLSQANNNNDDINHKIQKKNVKRLSKLKKKRPSREVTKHVQTRWYRAPEVILLEQEREKLCAVDMWSVGCILAELFQMKRNNLPLPNDFEPECQYLLRGPLFPGKSCFPLTAKDPFDYESRNDQLNIIFDMIGTPSNDEINKIKDNKAKKYLLSLEEKNGQDLKLLFPDENDKSLNLLSKLLQFDVDKRITVDEALEHPYLKKVRAKNAEQRHETAIFDFEDYNLSIDDLKQLILNEIFLYNPDFEEHDINNNNDN
jgi:mitogen-activated protein kinase 1/3